MKKKDLLAHKTILAAVCLACALSMSACGSRDEGNENKDPLTGEDMSQTDTSQTEGSSEAGSQTAESANGFSEFDTMLDNEETDPNEIISYINTNIVNAGANDVKRFFTGILSFGDDVRDIDLTGLNDSRKYMPEDMVAFMELMSLETEKPSMKMSSSENRRVINMTLSEMLERAVMFENHLVRYPEGVSTDAAARLYEEIATNAISGGYDKVAGTPHHYKGESEDTVDRESLQYYRKFADANKDSNLGQIVEDYIEVLQASQFKIDDNVIDFYKGLHQRLDARKLAERMDPENGGSGTGAAGNGNGTNSTNGTSGTGTTNGTNGTNGTSGTGTDAENVEVDESSTNDTASIQRNVPDAVMSR